MTRRLHLKLRLVSGLNHRSKTILAIVEIKFTGFSSFKGLINQNNDFSQ